MDPTGDNAIHQIQEDEGYEKPSSTSDMEFYDREPQDMTCNEAIPRYVPSEDPPIRPSVIMSAIPMLPDSTTPEASSDIMQEIPVPIRPEIAILMEYVRELVELDEPDIRAEHWIHSAARDGRTEVVAALAALGVRPDIRSAASTTALHEASGAGRYVTIDFLLSLGADIEDRTDTGRTPLHFAAGDGHYMAAFRLLVAGAQANAIDDHGATPEALARSNGHQDVADFILNAEFIMEILNQ